MSKIVDVRNLSYKYHDGTEALRNISFTIDEGESVGVIGPNGAGKSTLLHHLNGILPEKKTKESSVLIAGIPINNDTQFEVHKIVGLLFQNPDDQLFCPTVFEDVAFGPRQFGKTDDEVRILVKEALEKVGLSGYEKRSSHHLSGGEKQRVCIAGILACQPKILALDEPTKDLDPRGRGELKNLLRSISTTKIIASHDLELIAELCTRVFVLDMGRIVAEGEAVDILSNEELMLAHGLEKPHILKHQHPH